MQVIYGVPFAVFSVLGFLVCAVVPRWQRYKFQALVAPVAFGFCSIVAGGAIILTSDHFNLGLFTRPWSGPRDALPLILIYFIPGLVGAWAAGRAMQTVLFGVNSVQFGVLAATFVVTVLVVLFACLLPARRAANVDPMVALRYE